MYLLYSENDTENLVMNEEIRGIINKIILENTGCIDYGRLNLKCLSRLILDWHDQDNKVIQKLRLLKALIDIQIEKQKETVQVLSNRTIAKVRNKVYDYKQQMH